MDHFKKIYTVGLTYLLAGLILLIIIPFIPAIDHFFLQSSILTALPNYYWIYTPAIIGLSFITIGSGIVGFTITKQSESKDK